MCHIDDFKPYFYVKIPEEWSKNDFEVYIIKNLKDIYWKKDEDKKETNKIDNIKYFNRKYELMCINCLNVPVFFEIKTLAVQNRFCIFIHLVTSKQAFIF